VSVASTSRQRVLERVRVLEKARDEGGLVKLPEHWTVAAWLEHWLENISRPLVKRSTYEGYRAAVHVHLIPGIGQHRLSSLGPSTWNACTCACSSKTRRGTTMTPGRVHQVHRTLRAALNEAVRRGHIRQSPAELAKAPTGDDQEVVPYSVDDVRRIFTATGNRRNGTRWVVALALGLRQGGALGLQWGDVDWNRAVLTIRRSRTRPRYAHGCVANCGHKYAGHCPNRIDDRPTTDTTKSRAGRRVVPLPAAILELLRHHAGDQAQERNAAAQLWVDEGWVFATEIGTPINPRSDWDAWKKLLRDAGVRDGRLHDARHTAATVLLFLGVHEQAIMSILGWSSTAMVSRYAHVVAPIHGEVATRLDRLLWSSSDPHS
jgi:integrase